jgi:hypothetical protein
MSLSNIRGDSGVALIIEADLSLVGADSRNGSQGWQGFEIPRESVFAATRRAMGIRIRRNGSVQALKILQSQALLRQHDQGGPRFSSGINYRPGTGMDRLAARDVNRLQAE